MSALSQNSYGRVIKAITENIILHVLGVFITDKSKDMMLSYLGVVDGDGRPLNVSGETLQQHRPINKTKKISDDKHAAFCYEYSAVINQGAIEDTANQTRLA